MCYAVLKIDTVPVPMLPLLNPTWRMKLKKLPLHSQLVPKVESHHQNTLIRQFPYWKGVSYIYAKVFTTCKKVTPNKGVTKLT